MNFIVGGGVHEHGRNCFYVEADINYIVDCGIMRGAEKPYPRLTPEQIKSAKYLFLTHMHEDHIGAFGWLVKNGFCGLVVASDETIKALPGYDKTLVLPQAFGKVNIGTVGIEYGRSGHCVGSLWYAVTTQSSKLLFSGDYCEHSCFNVDKIEGQSAELAVLDCALGNMPYNRRAQEEKIISFARETLKNGSLLLPVPKNGRAVDLIHLLGNLNCNFFVDGKLCAFFSAQEKSGYWIPRAITGGIETLIYKPVDTRLHGVYLIADAQLATDAGKKTARHIAEDGGKVLFTGHADEGSEAQRLLSEGLAEEIVYNAHCCMDDDITIIARNNFDKVIYNHCKNI